MSVVEAELTRQPTTQRDCLFTGMSSHALLFETVGLRLRAI